MVYGVSTWCHFIYTHNDGDIFVSEMWIRPDAQYVFINFAIVDSPKSNVHSLIQFRFDDLVQLMWECSWIQIGSLNSDFTASLVSLDDRSTESKRTNRFHFLPPRIR